MSPQDSTSVSDDAGQSAISLESSDRFINRELSWLSFNMRVLEEGTVEAGDSFEKLQTHPMGLSITALTRLRYHKTLDRGAIEQALQNVGLAAEDRKALTSRLKRATS